MEMNLDQVRQELTDIHDELLSLPQDDFDRRAELQDRKNELRQLSAKLIEGEPLHDAATLRAAFHRLQDVRDKLLAQQVDPGSTGAMDTGFEGEFTAMVNKAMQSGLGVDEIEARMAEIVRQMKSAG